MLNDKFLNLGAYMLFKKHKDLSEELNCSWGNRDDLHLLEKDLSIEENLTMAMNRFPMLEKLVNKYKFSLQEIERCRKECCYYVFSDKNEILQLKEFFSYWLLWS